MANTLIHNLAVTILANIADFLSAPGYSRLSFGFENKAKRHFFIFISGFELY